VGYGGSVPTRFREASSDEVKKLKKSRLRTISMLLTEELITSDDFRLAVRVVFYLKKFDELRDLPQLCEKFPQLTPYVEDFLRKKGQDIPATIRELIARRFCRWLLRKDPIPEYLAVSIIRLLGSEGYSRSADLMKYFRNLKRNAGSYIGRVTLEAIEPFVDRGIALELRTYYDRADLWERRQIIRIVDKVLPREEKRAWYKNLMMNESSEILTTELVSFYMRRDNK
jgi:hypothetical protein